MELTPDKPRMSLNFDHLDQRTIRGKSAKVQSVFDERVAILVVDFVAVAMSLTDLGDTVDLGSESSGPQSTWIGAESHRAAHIGDVLLILHQGNHRVAAFGRKLAGMTVLQTDHVARELDDRRLHPKTDPEEWKSRFTSVANCLEHPFHAAHPEAAGNENAVKISE